jgi:hypothetical protein
VNTTDLFAWHPTVDEVRLIVDEMRPILEAAATRADQQIQGRR